MTSYQIRKYYVHLRCDSLEFKIIQMKEVTNNTREKIQMKLPTLPEFRILKKSAGKYVRRSFIVGHQTY